MFEYERSKVPFVNDNKRYNVILVKECLISSSVLRSCIPVVSLASIFSCRVSFSGHRQFTEIYLFSSFYFTSLKCLMIYKERYGCSFQDQENVRRLQESADALVRSTLIMIL
ncbi:hypothetical protein QVD17_02383 [Tagetes erecta]|uniref:Uncharacterized protein n=1 Tax=Tagetes erecta TaxID=13708 RepID=A0AAD8LCK8_TARER|nr:hypothetical protein QVD17_02383 [Tagetes erecta]